MFDEVMALARDRLALRGPVDEAALAERGHRLLSLLEDWELRIDASYDEGVGFPVLAVTRADGTPAVLKLGADAQQIRTLLAAGGRGYARALGADAARDAVLLERLGEALRDTAAAPVEQARTAAGVLVEAWDAVPLTDGAELPAGKAAQLVGIIDDLAPRYAARHRHAVELARQTAEMLSWDETAEVVCHGDPHPGNCLRRADGWAYVDPDGFRGERAYDLGVVMRDFSREFAAEQERRTGAGVALLQRVCRELARATGVPGMRIWNWAFVERVTTGLYLHRLGFPEQGESYLNVADRLAA